MKARSVYRARNAIKNRLALTPDTTEVRQADRTWVGCPAGQVALYARARVGITV